MVKMVAKVIKASVLKTVIHKHSQWTVSNINGD